MLYVIYDITITNYYKYIQNTNILQSLQVIQYSKLKG